jgi:MFS family permease
MSATRIIAGMCAAHVASIAGFATFPALLPVLQPLWGLSNTEAGWLAGVTFAGYVGSVPLLVSMTDRIDPRRIYLVGLALSTVGLAGFAFAAIDFWTALLWQAIMGMGVGGTYMTGLKAMVDQSDTPPSSRAIAFYTSGFSVGTGLSFLMAGEIAATLGWQWAFGLAALGPVAAAVIALVVLAPRPPDPALRPDTHLFDYRPVFRNRVAMGYILGYAGHAWELFALRGWMVAFLVFAGASQGGAGLFSATVIALVANIVAVAFSILGNEICKRYGRQRVIGAIMVVSFIGAVLTGASTGLGLAVVAVAVVIYFGMIMGDSSSLTAGAIAAASPHYRGTTIAVHTMIGFSGGLVGPIAVGIVLDVAGGQQSAMAWIWAFAAMGFGSLAGAGVLTLLTHRGPAASPDTEAS